MPAPDLAALLEGFAARKPAALARLITRIDDGRDAGEILGATDASAIDWRPRTVGVTGPPGCGKSTLIAALAAEIRRGGETVAVLAVDPDSPVTGGALLGDRIRMHQETPDPGLFFRSFSARGSQGGMSASIASAAALLAAWGFDWIIIETVGAGQCELSIAGVASIVVLVLNPGAGDEVQFDKAGQMEIADVFVLNKADMPGIDALESGVTQSLMAAEASPLASHRAEKPSVLRAKAATGDGVAALAKELAGRRSRIVAGARAPKESREQLARRVRLMIQAEVERLLRPGEIEERVMREIERGGAVAPDSLAHMVAKETLRALQRQ